MLKQKLHATWSVKTFQPSSYCPPSFWAQGTVHHWIWNRHGQRHILWKRLHGGILSVIEALKGDPLPHTVVYHPGYPCCWRHSSLLQTPGNLPFPHHCWLNVSVWVIGRVTSSMVDTHSSSKIAISLLAKGLFAICCIWKNSSRSIIPFPSLSLFKSATWSHESKVDACLPIQLHESSLQSFEFRTGDYPHGNLLSGRWARRSRIAADRLQLLVFSISPRYCDAEYALWIQVLRTPIHSSVQTYMFDPFFGIVGF